MKTIYKVFACLVILLYTDTSLAYGSYQDNWRWRNDDGDVYSASWKDSLNTIALFKAGENIRLRTVLRIEPAQGSHQEVSLFYSDNQIYNWTPVNNLDTGKFYICNSQYIADTASYFDNQMLSSSKYKRTITLDSSSTYNLFCSDTSEFELEYSLKVGTNIQPEVIYYFSLLVNNSMLKEPESGYPGLTTSKWITQLSGTECNLRSVYFTDVNTGIVVGDSGMIIRTTDGGHNWYEQESGTNRNLYDVFFINENTGTAVGEYGWILRTTDGGSSWINQPSYTNNNLHAVHFTDLNTGSVVGAGGTILRTLNGKYWFKQGCGTTEALNGVYFYDTYNGTAVGRGFFRTTNGGQSWKLQYPLTNYELRGIFFADQNLGVAVGGNGGMYRTTDGGATDWRKVNNIPANCNLASVHFINDSTGWAVGDKGTVLKTTDRGISWERLSCGFGNNLSSVYFVNNKTGWAVGTNGRIIKPDIITSAGPEETAQVIEKYFLSNNFPNPFNPSTKVKYTIPQPSQVEIVIYDLLGNKIKTLINEEKAAGVYEITWNADNVPTGVYFYQLKAGNFIETKKLILIK